MRRRVRLLGILGIEGNIVLAMGDDDTEVEDLADNLGQIEITNNSNQINRKNSLVTDLSDQNYNQNELIYKPSSVKQMNWNNHLIRENKASVIIPYREGGKVKGKAAFYDHYAIQRAINYPTLITRQEGTDVTGIYSYIPTIVHTLSLGRPQNGKIVPEIIRNSFEGGLLVIPGRTREENYTIRSNYEKLIIKEALNRGQPILSICAGSWQLWERFKGSLCEVTDHTNRQMISIGINGNITYNKQMHLISIESNSLLFKTMGKEPKNELTVNSVHWKAPDIEKNWRTDLLKIGAWSVYNNSLAPTNKTPQSNTVEAFETIYGTPVLGILWHPEAYNSIDFNDTMITPQQHINLLNYMAQAGNAYYIKGIMLKEFLEKINSLTNNNNNNNYKINRYS